MTWIYISAGVGGLIWCIVWGIVTNKIISNKGYSENWFWWGFFLGFIGMIVALTKPDNHSGESSSYVNSKLAKSSKHSVQTNAVSQKEAESRNRTFAAFTIFSVSVIVITAILYFVS